MQTFSFVRCALSISAAAMLAACGGLQPPTGAPQAISASSGALVHGSADPATYICSYTHRTVDAAKLFDVKTHKRTPFTLHTGRNAFWVDASGHNRLSSAIRLKPGGGVRAGQFFYVSFGSKDDHKLTIEQVKDKLSKGSINLRFYGCSY